jgi:hypothetical protein
MFSLLLPLIVYAQVGENEIIGRTWHDLNASSGRRLAQSDDDYLHFTWTSSLEVGQNDIFYNFIDPEGSQGWPETGIGVENTEVAGSPCIDIYSTGQAFIAFYRQYTGTDRWNAAVALDFMPHTGAFLTYEPDWVGDLELRNPRFQFDRDENIRLVATEIVSGPGIPRRHYYTEGYYNPAAYTISFPPTPDTWTEIDYTLHGPVEVAVSPVSDKIAFAWMTCRDEGFPQPGGLYSQMNNDIWMLIDDDGEDLHFEDAFNITNFVYPDLAWLPDTLLACGDTIRAYNDISVLIDHDDWVHIAFTTIAYYELYGITRWHPSAIWHWSDMEVYDYKLIHNAYDDWWWNTVGCGAYNYKAQRPTLGINPQNGYLYCTYQVYDCDTTALSSAGWPSGEIYVSVSEDNGENWAVGTNITETITPGGALPGQCLSEISPSMAKTVDDTCRIQYVLDKDAGCVLHDEGAWTQNDVIYHEVPAEQIPTHPIVSQDILFHVEHITYCTVAVTNQDFKVIEELLNEVFPNPFNPTTTISFDLPVASLVSLDIFDINGRRVIVGAQRAAPEIDAHFYPPGTHSIPFDGTNLPSGIYIYCLKAGEYSTYGKMVLMK